jgi:hypothetical protein
MKLALYGQWEDVSGLIYTFPEKTSDLPEWAKSLFDPRNVRGIFKGDYCYALWYNNNGYYYSCIKTNTDSRNGCVMLTILAGKMVPLDGKLMVEKMRMLLDYCLSKNNYADIAYADILFKAKEIESLFTYRALMENESSMPDKEMAYRLYNNDDDLALIMENPNQHSYANYKRVLVIDKSAWGGESVNSPTITQITCPVKKTYDIRFDSNDIVVNKESVMDGETFSITYRKTGFADECVNVVVGKQNDYYHIDGNIINLKSASDIGINFKKEIMLRVVDEETHNTIKTWSYKIDDNIKNNNVEDADEIVSIKLAPDSQHKITVSAEGYENNTLELAKGEFGQKQISLRPLDNLVFVRLQLGKEKYCDSVRMKSNNKLFYPLKRLDDKHKVLQVKLPFFSRRNRVSILVLFLISFLFGGFVSSIVFKEKKPQHQPEKMVAKHKYDSVCVELTNQKTELQQARQNLDNKEEDNQKLTELLEKYGNILTTVRTKLDNTSTVVTILNGQNYHKILNGQERDKNVFNKMEKELNDIKKDPKRNDPGGTGAHSPDVDQLLQSNMWDLNQIKQCGQEWETFVEKITNAQDINTLCTSNFGVYIKARNNNVIWNHIMEKAKDLDDGDKLRFASFMNESPQKVDNKLDLKIVSKYFDK